MKKSKTFDATIDSFDSAMTFVESYMEEIDCPLKLQTQIGIAFEEMYVNVCHYAYGDATGNVEVQIDCNDGIVTVQIIDSGVAFDPLQKEDPDITLSADERKIGGLGIMMVKKIMDNVEYQRLDGKNVFSMSKKIN